MPWTRVRFFPRNAAPYSTALLVCTLLFALAAPVPEKASAAGDRRLPLARAAGGGRGLPRQNVVSLGVFLFLEDYKGRAAEGEARSVFRGAKRLLEQNSYGEYRLLLSYRGSALAQSLGALPGDDVESDDSSMSSSLQLAEGLSKEATRELRREKQKLRRYRALFAPLRKRGRPLSSAGAVLVLSYKESQAPAVEGMSYFDGAFTSENIGIVNVRAADSPSRKAAVAAHELGHILGSLHDGDENECAPKGGIMETYKPLAEGENEGRLAFSPCSMRYIARTIERRAKRHKRAR